MIIKNKKIRLIVKRIIACVFLACAAMLAVRFGYDAVTGDVLIVRYTNFIEIFLLVYTSCFVARSAFFAPKKNESDLPVDILSGVRLSLKLIAPESGQIICADVLKMRRAEYADNPEAARIGDMIDNVTVAVDAEETGALDLERAAVTLCREYFSPSCEKDGELRTRIARALAQLAMAHDLRFGGVMPAAAALLTDVGLSELVLSPECEDAFVLLMLYPSTGLSDEMIRRGLDLIAKPSEKCDPFFFAAWGECAYNRVRNASRKKTDAKCDVFLRQTDMLEKELAALYGEYDGLMKHNISMSPMSVQKRIRQINGIVPAIEGILRKTVFETSARNAEDAAVMLVLIIRNIRLFPVEMRISALIGLRPFIKRGYRFAETCEASRDTLCAEKGSRIVIRSRAGSSLAGLAWKLGVAASVLAPETDVNAICGILKKCSGILPDILKNLENGELCVVSGIEWQRNAALLGEPLKLLFCEKFDKPYPAAAAQKRSISVSVAGMEDMFDVTALRSYPAAAAAFLRRQVCRIRGESEQLATFYAYLLEKGLRDREYTAAEPSANFRTLDGVLSRGVNAETMVDYNFYIISKYGAAVQDDSADAAADEYIGVCNKKIRRENSALAVKPEMKYEEIIYGTEEYRRAYDILTEFFKRDNLISHYQAINISEEVNGMIK